MCSVILDTENPEILVALSWKRRQNNAQDSYYLISIYIEMVKVLQALEGEGMTQLPSH